MSVEQEVEYKGKIFRVNDEILIPDMPITLKGYGKGKGNGNYDSLKEFIKKNKGMKIKITDVFEDGVLGLKGFSLCIQMDDFISQKEENKIDNYKLFGI